MPPKSKQSKEKNNVVVVARGTNRLRQPLWVMPDACKNCAGYGERCVRRGLAGSCERCHGRKVACNLRKHVVMFEQLVCLANHHTYKVTMTSAAGLVQWEIESLSGDEDEGEVIIGVEDGIVGVGQANST